jgi:ABC-type microcin C transport system permease subunit YejE
MELPAWSVWGVIALSVLALFSGVEAASLPARVALLACGVWLFARALHGHLEQYFDRPAAYVSTTLLLVFLVLAVFAPEFSPQNPYDLAQLSIMDGRLPPGSASSDGALVFRLGTDEQGRDIYSGILYGLRVSLTVSLVATFVAMAIGHPGWAGPGDAIACGGRDFGAYRSLKRPVPHRAAFTRPAPAQPPARRRTGDAPSRSAAVRRCCRRRASP